MANSVGILSELANRYTRLFESAQDGILILDHPEGRIIDANPYICRLIGFTAKELAGKKLWELGVFADKARALETFKSILSAGYVRYEDLDLVTKAGKRLSVEFICNSYPIDSHTLIQCNIRDISARKEAEVALVKERAKLAKQMTDTIDSLSNVIEARDPYTAGHQARVTDLAVEIAREMELTPSQTDCIRFCAQIHDIGKISIPAEILTKPSALSPLEVAMLRGHVQAGVDIIKPISFPWPVAEIILQHHERLDGSGYPNGLKAEAICLEARVMMVADTLEAITSDRPYRPAKGIETALREIEAGSGRLYDPKVVAACINLFRKKGYQFPDLQKPAMHRL